MPGKDGDDNWNQQKNDKRKKKDKRAHNDNGGAGESSTGGGGLNMHAPVFTPRNIPELNTLTTTVNELANSNFDFHEFWLSLPRNQRRKKELEDEWEIDTALDWTGYIDKDESQYVIGTGTYGDVHKGKWNKVPQRSDSLPPIVIKYVRTGGKGQMKQLKQVKREMKVWSALRHKNILQFVGFIVDNNGFPGLISLYMDFGTVRDYISTHPEASKTKLLLGIAEGLEYLHTYDPKIVHGDLKADNVLVDRRGTPCLCDFGVSRMLENQTLWRTTAEAAPGTLRWMAPELLAGTEAAVSRKADVYAYGMTALEIVSGDKPFHNIPYTRGDTAVLIEVVLKQKMPEIPNYVNVPPALKALWVECWSFRADDRPSAARLVNTMRQIRSSAIEDLTNVANQMDQMHLQVPGDSESESAGSRTPKSRFVDINVVLDRRYGGIKWNVAFPVQTVTATRPPGPDDPAFEPNLGKCHIRVGHALPLESLAWTIDIKAASPFEYITVIHLLQSIRASMKKSIIKTTYENLPRDLRKRIDAAYERRWQSYPPEDAEMQRLEGIKRVDMLLDQTGYSRLKPIRGTVDTFELILTSSEELSRPPPKEFRVAKSTEFIGGDLESVENDVPPTVLQMQQGRRLSVPSFPSGFVPSEFVISENNNSLKKRRKS